MNLTFKTINFIYFQEDKFMNVVLYGFFIEVKTPEYFPDQKNVFCLKNGHR